MSLEVGARAHTGTEKFSVFPATNGKSRKICRREMYGWLGRLVEDMMTESEHAV